MGLSQTVNFQNFSLKKIFLRHFGILTSLNLVSIEINNKKPDYIVGQLCHAMGEGGNLRHAEI